MNINIHVESWRYELNKCLLLYKSSTHSCIHRWNNMLRMLLRSAFAGPRACSAPSQKVGGSARTGIWAKIGRSINRGESHGYRRVPDRVPLEKCCWQKTTAKILGLMAGNFGYREFSGTGHSGTAHLPRRKKDHKTSANSGSDLQKLRTVRKCRSKIKNHGPVLGQACR